MPSLQTYIFDHPEWVSMDHLRDDPPSFSRFAMQRLGGLPMAGNNIVQATKEVASVPLHALKAGYHGSMATTRFTISLIPFSELELIIADDHGAQTFKNIILIIQDIYNATIYIATIPLALISPYVTTNLLEALNVHETKTSRHYKVLLRTIDPVETFPPTAPKIKTVSCQQPAPSIRMLVQALAGLVTAPERSKKPDFKDELEAQVMQFAETGDPDSEEINPDWQDDELSTDEPAAAKITHKIAPTGSVGDYKNAPMGQEESAALIRILALRRLQYEE